jgi:hypothetical protein
MMWLRRLQDHIVSNTFHGLNPHSIVSQLCGLSLNNNLTFNTSSSNVADVTSFRAQMRSVRKSSPLLLRKWTLELRGRGQRPTVRAGRWCKLSIFMDTYLIQKTYEGFAHRLTVQRAEGLSLEPVTTFSKTTRDQEHILLACMRLHGILPTLCATS